MEKFYVEVKPKIIYPRCISKGEQQDCFRCDYRDYCKSPRALCIASYKNHKRGCPNYGKKADCPPLAPMFDEVFDMTKPIYAIYSVYDLKSHMEKMKSRHPQWTETQLRNVLYWQGTAKKYLKENIQRFKQIYSDKGYYVTCSPEAMGVDVLYTMRKAGVPLEWPVSRDVYKVAFAGITLNENFQHILL